jgi:sugar phosphate isomerase/epimerase
VAKNGGEPVRVAGGTASAIVADDSYLYWTDQYNLYSAPVGGGEFDNVAQIRALLKDGYRGAFTLETHWKGPNGKAASTETSLKGLLEVIFAV